MGKLVLISGISGAGKDSYDEFIKGFFGGLSTHFFQEPSEFLRGVIKKYRTQPLRDAQVEVDLFAVDRKHQLRTIVQPLLDDPSALVVMKRSWLDSLVYQSQQGVDPEYIRRQNDFFPEPDLSLCFLCQPEIAAQRISARAQGGGEKASLDETVEVIRQRMQGYQTLLPSSRIVRTDGSFEAVKAQLASHFNRLMGVPMSKAVLLDKDGTLVSNDGYPDMIPTDEVMFEHTLEGLKRLQSAGYKLHIISSQPWVARGRMSVEEVDQVFRSVLELYAGQGVVIDGFSYCPHERDGSCRCKKPQTLLFEEYVAARNVDTTASFYVGDMANDVLSAQNMGMTSVLVRTGSGRKHESRCSPDIIVDDINEFARRILEKTASGES